MYISKGQEVEITNFLKSVLPANGGRDAEVGDAEQEEARVTGVKLGAHGGALTGAVLLPLGKRV